MGGASRDLAQSPNNAGTPAMLMKLPNTRAPMMTKNIMAVVRPLSMKASMRSRHRADERNSANTSALLAPIPAASMGVKTPP